MPKRPRCKPRFVRATGALLAGAVVFTPFTGCKRKAVPHLHEVSERDEAEASATPTVRRILAAWYRVPKDSIAKKRAPHELTAAHNSLPIGTRVRVTNPENDRSVIVRITDRGIHDRRVNLDLCKEAAQELDVVEEGFAHLRLQVLDDDAD